MEGQKQYELTNHLGNVFVTLSDKKIPVDTLTSDTAAKYYLPLVITSQDYYPFGMVMPGRNYSTRYNIAETVRPDFLWNFDKGNLTEIEGSGHNATSYGAVDTVDDRCGDKSAYECNVSSTYIKVPDNSDFDPGSSDFSVSIWVKKLSATVSWNGNQAVNKWYNGGSPGTNEWALSISGSSDGSTPGTFVIESGTTKYTATGTTLVNLNEWYHLVGVREGDSLRFYLNGEQEGVAYCGSVSVNNVGRDLLIGRMASGYYAHAYFDDFAYYKRALSKEEVKTLYNVVGCDFEDLSNLGNAYRFGFNGKEKTDELYGIGNAYDYGARMYDARLGRPLSIDPLFKKFPMLSPYQFFSDSPIEFVDLDGMEAATQTQNNSSTQETNNTEIRFRLNFKFSLSSGIVGATANTIVKTEAWLAPFGGVKGELSFHLDYYETSGKFDFGMTTDSKQYQSGSNGYGLAGFDSEHTNELENETNMNYQTGVTQTDNSEFNSVTSGSSPVNEHTETTNSNGATTSTDKAIVSVGANVDALIVEVGASTSIQAEAVPSLNTNSSNNSTNSISSSTATSGSGSAYDPNSYSSSSSGSNSAYDPNSYGP